MAAVVAPSSPRQSASLTSTLVSSHSGSSSSPSSSSSSSAADSDSDSDADSDDEEDDETTLRLKDLLLKAKESARAKASGAALPVVAVDATDAGDELAGNDEVVLFGDDEEEESDEEDDEEDGTTPRPSTSKSSSSKPKVSLPPSLVRPLHLRAPTAASLISDPKGKGRALTLAQDLGGDIESSGSGKGDRWGQAPVQQRSKKERQALKAPTAGPKWFNMPATPMTPELKREIQALRLRNALDPKRFYKGGAKDSKKMPEFFQLGHVLPSHSGSVSTATPAIARKRTFVEELVDDEQAKAYTKRKTAEVQARGMSGRRGGNRKGASKKGRKG